MEKLKIISLGLGVQSTALLYMSSFGYMDRADYAIFADTGAEKQATMDYYNRLWDEKNNRTKFHNLIPIIKVSERNIYKDYLNKIDKRVASIPAFTSNGGKLMRQCTAEYKISQVDSAIRNLYGMKKGERYPETEIWYGISQDEMQRMSIPQQKWKINVYPFIGYKIFSNGTTLPFNCIHSDYGPFMRHSDLIEFYKKMNKWGACWPIPIKSSCVFCPFTSNKNWALLKNIATDDFSRAVEIDQIIRHRLKIDNTAYIHRSLKPLKDINFDDLQEDLFDDECSGNCMI